MHLFNMYKEEQGILDIVETIIGRNEVGKARSRLCGKCSNSQFNPFA